MTTETNVDAALLWAREKVKAEQLPRYHADIDSGAWDGWRKLIDWAEAFRAGQAHADAAQAAEIARLTKWHPIETAPDDDWFLAAIEVRHKNGGHWWEYHVVWLDDETSDVHTECEQGWSITDYSHWLALPNAPYPLSAAQRAIAAAKGHDNAEG